MAVSMHDGNSSVGDTDAAAAAWDAAPVQTADEENQQAATAPMHQRQDPLCCPLTGKPFENPVVHPRDGVTYEGQAIQERDGLGFEYYPNRALKDYLSPSTITVDEELQLATGSSKKRMFLCPITHDLMRDPVIDPDGISYERAAIMGCISQQGISPITRKPLREDQLYDNTTLLTLLLEEIEQANESLDPEDIENWKKEMSTYPAQAPNQQARYPHSVVMDHSIPAAQAVPREQPTSQELEQEEQTQEERLQDQMRSEQHGQCTLACMCSSFLVLILVGSHQIDILPLNSKHVIVLLSMVAFCTMVAWCNCAEIAYRRRRHYLQHHAPPLHRRNS